MIDYSKSKIYKLISLSNPELTYYGSTTNPYLSRRFAQHMCSFRKQAKYYTAWEILKFNDCQIVLVENYPCSTNEELHKKEYEYISNNVCVNKMKTGNSKTNREYYDENKETIKQRANQYYTENKEQVLKTIQNYREQNKVKIKERQHEYHSFKMTCDICNKVMRRDNIKKHKTKIHKIILE